MACSRPAERRKDMKIAQIQSHVYSEKMENLEQLEVRLRELDGQKPDLVMLGEMFCCPTRPACSRPMRRMRVALCGAD